MAGNIKYTAVKKSAVTTSSPVKNYGKSAYVTKKTQEARETLRNFPAPEQYSN